MEPPPGRQDAGTSTSFSSRPPRPTNQARTVEPGDRRLAHVAIKRTFFTSTRARTCRNVISLFQQFIIHHACGMQIDPTSAETLRDDFAPRISKQNAHRKPGNHDSRWSILCAWVWRALEPSGACVGKSTELFFARFASAVLFRDWFHRVR